MQRFPFQSWLNYNPLLPASDKWSTPLNSPHHDDFKKVWFVACLTTARTTPASREGVNSLDASPSTSIPYRLHRNMVLREHNLPDKSYSRAMLSLQKLVFDWLFHCVSIAAYLQAFLNFMMRLNIRLARRWKKSMIKDNMKHYKL